MRVMDVDARLLATANIALLFSGSLLWPASVDAASVNVVASATVVAPAQVTADAALRWQFSANFGVLTLSIPGAGGLDDPEPLKKMTLTMSGEVAWDSPMVFSASDSGGLAALISRLVTSGGSLATSGTLSGMDVQIVVLEAAQSGDGGTVTAIVSYN